MSSTPLILHPGINTEKTLMLNEAGWSFSQLIRFFQSMIQKLGGWSRLTSVALIGTCRGMFAWADLTGIPYVACGTEQRLEVFNFGTLYDITPIAATSNLTTPFTSVSTSKIVEVTDAGHNPAAGDWINIVSYVSTDNGILQGLYQVTNVIDSTHYDIVVPNAASSSGSSGTVALFTTVNTSTQITVTLNGHGLVTGNIFTVFVSTTVATIVIFGQYTVTVVDANNFHITGGSAANASTSGSENNGHVRIQYLLSTGLLNPVIAMGYGEGGYGLGPYGIGGTSTASTPIRQWSMGAFGRILIAAPTMGGVYEWDPASGFFENPAAVVTNSPPVVEGIFIAMPQQQIVAYGITDPNTSEPDPMLVGWCDVADFTDWTASATNQAGTFRLSRGSRIVGGIQGPQYQMLWTDLGFWLQQYIGFPLVYGFNEIGQGCGLLSMRAQCVLGGKVYWISLNQFNQFDGQSVQELPCAVWDIFFKNLNSVNQDKIQMGANSHFNEFIVFYPSVSGNGENDSYIKYQNKDNAWDYGSLIRTAWFDQSVAVNGNPLGVDGAGLIQQHESTNDADGLPMSCSASTGWFKVAEGDLYMFIECLIPDLILNNATIQITVFFTDYPQGETTTALPTIQKGPFTVTAASPPYIIVRGRGRLARVQVTSSDLGSFWRLGECLYFGSQTGKR